MKGNFADDEKVTKHNRGDEAKQRVHGERADDPVDGEQPRRGFIMAPRNTTNTPRSLGRSPRHATGVRPHALPLVKGSAKEQAVARTGGLGDQTPAPNALLGKGGPCLHPLSQRCRTWYTWRGGGVGQRIR